MLRISDFKQGTKNFFCHYNIKEDPDNQFSALCSVIKKFSLLPYENITKIIKHNKTTGFERLRLPDEVIEDHIKWNTGGTCFSLSFLLLCILEELQIDSYIVMADRSYGKNTHCAIISILKGVKYLVDPGFLVDFPLPLPVSDEIETTDTLRKYVLKKTFTSNSFEFFSVKQNKFEQRYILKDIPVSLSEFESYWINSFDFNMMHSILFTKNFYGKRLYLRDKFVKITEEDISKNQKIKADFASSVSDISGIPRVIIEEAKDLLNKHRNKKL